MSIPIVIFHTGGAPDYLISCVNISSKTNQVYLIGDDSNQSTFLNNPNVRFFHINDLSTNEIEQFKLCFINYSGNDANYEMYCFLRIFYLKSLFERTGLDWVLHTDSDCIILQDINELFPSPSSVAYSIHKTANEFHMGASIHNALLNRRFCNTFVELCFDIYQNKTRFGLIEKKIQWHQQTGMPGGICDMTLYYLIHSENMISPIIDLNEPLEFDSSYIVFDLHYSESYGYNGNDTYAMEDWYKRIIKREGKFYFVKTDGQEIRTASIHFQGQRAKRVLVEEFDFTSTPVLLKTH
jgi:hypothetical protein